MPMTILAAITEASGADFRNRVLYLLEKAAVNVSGEDPAAAQHTARAALAAAILNSPRSFLDPFVMATLANLDLTTLTTLAAISDANLQTALNGIYNLFT